MANVTGAFDVEVNGQTFTLFFGMSVIAKLQAKHGNDFFRAIAPPEIALEDQAEGVGAIVPDGWMPDMGIVVDVFLECLQRFHAKEADRWLVDDIIASSDDVMAMLGDLMASAFPDAPAGSGDEGNAQKP